MTQDADRFGTAYAAIEDPEKLRRILQATLLLESSRHLGDLLNRIVTEARALTGARFGALGVLDDLGTTTTDFLVSGLDPDDEARLLEGPLPTAGGSSGS